MFLNRKETKEHTTIPQAPDEGMMWCCNMSAGKMISDMAIWVNGTSKLAHCK